ncbi:MAG TPA: hypothetical protein VJ836_07170 [Candidatus Saccharimonadales bacterium]|nr:hypothetical protein [Candidatus Saccharimonadales bacterium]
MHAQNLQKRFTATLLMLALLSVFATAWVDLGTVTVQAAPVCKNNQTPDKDKCQLANLDDKKYRTCDPALPSCKTTDKNAGKCVGSDCGLIEKYLNPIINFLAAIVGVVVVIAIIIGGIQYSSSADDPNKVAQAKTRIINALLGLIAFMFLYAFLQWVIPGGL